MTNKDRIVAVGLLTEADVAQLGQSFERLWPVDETPCFSGLLTAIDDADRALWRDKDKAASTIGPVMQERMLFRGS